ncbi:hypothetical protein [Candidatus Odyssella thessalonicensis]|uniref:hypothetical protein n=1 Tax=Candidatus Odyssella thessalonicensis TaxID=84647 RepID=UPI000225B496|nr:hypothetical protein [Candidatus Odyssella thessalonicensis]
MDGGIDPDFHRPTENFLSPKCSLIEHSKTFSGKLNNLPAASTPLKTLNLSSSNLNDDDMDHVMSLIKEKSGFQALDLSNNQLRNSGIQRLFDDLPSTIKVINLSHNKLTVTLGVGGIMNRLEKTESLKALDLSYNFMSLHPIIGRAIGGALEKNPSLQKLKLRGMGLNYESFRSIRKGLRHNTKLSYLDISENPMNGILLLEDLIEGNTSLKHIEAEDCGITRDDFLDILVALNENQTLEYFAFDKNPDISDEELRLWAPRIEQDLGFKVDLQNHTLTRISPLKKPIPLEYYVYSTQQDQPSLAEKVQD